MIEEDEKRTSELPCSDVQRRLDESEWDQIYPRLVSYAKFKLQGVTWLGGHPPGGVEPKDLAQEAIASLYTGRRTWDVAIHQDLEVVLKAIVRSKVSHLSVNADNQTRQALSDDSGVDGWGHDAPSISPSPEQILVKNELIDKIEILLEDDEDAGMVFLYIQEGAKPKEIAEELGKPVTEIYSISKRIRRRIKKHLSYTRKVD